MRSAVLAIAIVLGLLIGIGAVYAIEGSDLNINSYNSCGYYAYAYYDTGPPRAWVEGGHYNCASKLFVSAYFWNGSFFVPYNSGWITDTHWFKYWNDPTSNVYGYTQIQKPLGSYSSTIEAHAN